MKTFFLIIFYITFFNSYAQNTVGGVSSKGMDMNLVPHGTIQEIEYRKPALVGSYYLNENWLVGSILLHKSGYVIDQVPIRYDLYHESIEIKDESSVKVINLIHVKSFSIVNQEGKSQNFMHGRYFLLNGIPLTGMLEVLEESDSLGAYKQTRAKIRKGSYVSALDMGNDQDEIIKDATFYIGVKDSLVKVESSRNKFSKQFKNNSKAIKSEIKVRDINLQEASGIVSLLDFIGEYL